MLDENNHRYEQVPWKGVDLFCILAVTVILVFFLGGILNVVMKGFNLFAGESRRAVAGLISTFFQDALLLGLSVSILSGKYKYPIKRRFFHFEAKAEIILNGLLGGVTILFVVMIVNAIIAAILMIFFHMETPQQEIIQLLLSTKNFWLFLCYSLLIVIIAPIVEEFFFRGLVYSYIRSKYGVLPAVLISSAFFGIMHMSIWAFTGTFLGGLGLAYLYEKSKSLYSSILAHMVWNGIITVLLYVFWNKAQYMG